MSTEENKSAKKAVSRKPKAKVPVSDDKVEEHTQPKKVSKPKAVAKDTTIQEELLSAISTEGPKKKTQKSDKVAVVAPKKSKKLVQSDPNVPKPQRTPTSYFIFLKEVRSKIKEEFPDLKSTEISKKAGEMWRELTDDQRNDYKKQSEDLKHKSKAE